jgi:aconitate hydratase
MNEDVFGARGILKVGQDYTIYRLNKLAQDGILKNELLPYSIRVMLESVLRQCNQKEFTTQHVINLAQWSPEQQKQTTLPFRPARVIMQDFTGVPAVVDLAAMRAAVAKVGRDPRQVNPLVPVDLVIDHSFQVDFFASIDSLQKNAEIEFQRNRERYEFLHWGQNAFDNFRVVPPMTGIVHQVNLEYLAKVVMTSPQNGLLLAYPDTLVGTDSHTTMINGLGVVGWGVGGIEAEAAMLGQPIDLVTPDVIGFKLTGELAEGVTATDLTLTVTQILRQKGVVDKFVEFYGQGLSSMTLPDRATIANMAPEYGATIGFFPVDSETLRYLRLTGRSEDLVQLVEGYCKEQGIFRTDESPDPVFTDYIELDLGTVVPSMAGPKRPQDRVPLQDLKRTFRLILTAPKGQRGYELALADLNRSVKLDTNGNGASEDIEMKHGAVVIASITSCTNTSNPTVMLGAGLLAKKAVERGMKSQPYVKTSLAPGSRVVTEYLEKAGLLEPLAELGFHVVGYGCATCIGNSGPLPGNVVKAVNEGNLVAAAVLSGNRNFEGRIHPYVRANYLASPPLVVAFALAGTVDIDLVNDPLGEDSHGNPVYLRDIWPTSDEIKQAVMSAVDPEMFHEKYADVFTGNETWNAISGGVGDLYNWRPDSTYIQEPPFFENLSLNLTPIEEITGARVLALLGDSITTDHISPAGSIPADSPAGKYLLEQGVPQREFNSYGSRRGNDRVMTRGTFANIRLKNMLTPDVEGGYTLYFGEGSYKGELMTIYDAAVRYKSTGTPLIVLAGKEYGTGSSRDWAAKGTLLLGVKAVIAESYERIHRSNLVGMGVLPLQFMPDENVETLCLTGEEVFSIEGLSNDIQPRRVVSITAKRDKGKPVVFQAIARLDTSIEVEYYSNGGILHTVLRKMIKD